MFPTLLDTKTGKTAVASNWDSSVFWWSEGSGSCDCNRAICLGEDIHDELEEQHGEGVCFGCARIVVVDVHGDLEGWDREDLLQDLNREYPEELRKHWSSTPATSQVPDK